MIPFHSVLPEIAQRGINPQSEFSGELLDLFQDIVLDEPYRLRLGRHYQMFREEPARRNTRNS
jgi:hypothetical protein